MINTDYKRQTETEPFQDELLFKVSGTELYCYVMIVVLFCEALIYKACKQIEK